MNDKLFITDIDLEEVRWPISTMIGLVLRREKFLLPVDEGFYGASDAGLDNVQLCERAINVVRRGDVLLMDLPQGKFVKNLFTGRLTRID